MLSKLRNRLRKSLRNERGQGATEYILLVAVVVGVVMIFGKSIKSKLSSTTDKLGTSIDTATDQGLAQ